MSTEKLHNGKKIAVGRRIKKIRGDLLQSEFGKILGVDGSAVSKYENGRVPALAILEKIAEFGRTTVGWILDGTEANANQLSYALSSQHINAAHSAGDTTLKINRKLLINIIVLTEECLEERHLKLPAQKKANLILLLYDRYSETTTPVAKATIILYLDLFSG